MVSGIGTWAGLITALRNALENAGIAIPEDQSKVLLDEPGSTP